MCLPTTVLVGAVYIYNITVLECHLDSVNWAQPQNPKRLPHQIAKSDGKVYIPKPNAGHSYHLQQSLASSQSSRGSRFPVDKHWDKIASLAPYSGWSLAPGSWGIWLQLKEDLAGIQPKVLSEAQPPAVLKPGDSGGQGCPGSLQQLR